MKKTYSKPLISVEELSLDQPIAGGCTADRADVESLKAAPFFYFISSDTTCKAWLGTGKDGHGGQVDWNRDGKWDYEETTVCYHSNLTVAFYS